MADLQVVMQQKSKQQEAYNKSVGFHDQKKNQPQEGSSQDQQASLQDNNQSVVKRPLASSVDGYRDLQTNKIQLLGVTPSIKPLEKSQKTCDQHGFCERHVAFLEEVGGEESFPGPFPDKARAADYVRSRFEQRHSQERRKLLVQGTVRPQEHEISQGVQLVVPTRDGIEEWLRQSKNLGDQIAYKNGVKRQLYASLQDANRANILQMQQGPPNTNQQQQQPYQNMNNNGPASNTGGVTVNTQQGYTEASFRSGGLPSATTYGGSTELGGEKPTLSHFLKPVYKRVPELPLNPNLKYNFDEAHLNHAPGSKNRQNSKNFKSLKNIELERAEKLQKEEMERREREKLNPLTFLRSNQDDRFKKKTVLGDMSMTFSLKANEQVRQEVAEERKQLALKMQREKSGAGGLIGTNKASSSLAKQPESIFDKLASMYGKKEDKEQRLKVIENRATKLFGIYNEKRKKDHKSQENKQETSQQFKSARTTTGGSKSAQKALRPFNSAPGYKHDLREQLEQLKPSSEYVEQRRQREVMALQEKWRGMVNIQDQFQDLKDRTEQQLINLHTKLNPIFDMKDLRASHKAAAGPDYLKEESMAKKRVALLESKGMEMRAENMKEDLRILDYMVDSGHVASKQKQGVNSTSSLNGTNHLMSEATTSSSEKAAGEQKKIEVFDRVGWEGKVIDKFHKITAQHPQKNTEWAQKMVQQRLNPPKIEEKPVNSDSEHELMNNRGNNILSASHLHQSSHLTSQNIVPTDKDTQNNGSSSNVDQKSSSNYHQMNKTSSLNNHKNIAALSATTSANNQSVNNNLRVQSGKTSHLSHHSYKQNSYNNVENANQKANPNERTSSAMSNQTGTVNRSQKTSKSASKKAKIIDTYMDPEFWYHKGVVLNQKNETDSALKCYQQALSLNQDHTPSIFNLACNHQKRKNYTLAKEWFQKAISVVEKWPDAYYGLALSCIKLKQHDEAVLAIEKAILHSGKNVQPQVRYVQALSYKEANNLEMALQSYRQILKDEKTVFDFDILVQKENQQTRQKKMSDDPSAINWRIDLYKHFYQQNLLAAESNNPKFCLDLWPYWKTPPTESDKELGWEKGLGWDLDKIPQVLDLLGKLRFFNRLEPDQIKRTLNKVTLTRVEPRGVLFLKPDESAIVIAGQLQLFSHEEDVAYPCLQAIFNPGDIVGLPEITNGWTTQQHDWIVAQQNCDIFVLSKEYMAFLWHCMKKNVSNRVVDLVKEAKGFKGLSEQTFYTIAHDLAILKEYDPGETIVHQDLKSFYNLGYQDKEESAISNLGKRDAHYMKIQNQFKRDAYPKITQKWDEHQTLREFNFYLNKLRIEKEQEKLTKGSQVKEEDPTAIVTQEQRDLKEQQENEAHERRRNRFIAWKADEPAKQVKEILGNVDSLAQNDNVKLQNGVKHLEQMIEKVEKFQKEKSGLPHDSQGIHIMVSGFARVENKYDNYTFRERPLQKGDYFGASKFIKNQGYSYFGDIVAGKADYTNKTAKQKVFVRNKAATQSTFLNPVQQSSDVQLTKFAHIPSADMTKLRSNKKVPIERGPNAEKHAHDDLDQQNNTEVCTCLTLPGHKLHLIPFYDLYRLRQLTRNEEEDFQNLRATSGCKRYREIIRQKKKRLHRRATLEENQLNNE